MGHIFVVSIRCTLMGQKDGGRLPLPLFFAMEGGMLMKILLFSYYFIVSVQFTFVIPNSFIEFSFAALIIIGSHFCEPFLY